LVNDRDTALRVGVLKVCCPKQDDDERVAVSGICRSLASRDRVRIEEGLTLVHQKYAYEMADWLRARFRTLQPDDIGEIWNDALFALARLALDGRFKEEGSLHGLIWRITRCRALDFLRRQRKQWPCGPFKGGGAYEDRRIRLDDNIRQEELLAKIRKAIDKLSGRQKAVLNAFASLEFDRKDEDFVIEASKRAGEPLTRAQVCEALSEGLKKVARYLDQRGDE
jgi:DNA-directed RNA polymerase specialized sigma24 family protein